MKILNFRIRGKMAHFRRYYSNSSALSYSVPPRTTIIGLIAGLLGYERDSYYDEFSPSQCRIAIGIGSPQKKQMQTLNLLMIKSSNDFNASQPFHSQTPTELITPTNIRTGFLDYEIWWHHYNSSMMDRFNELLQHQYAYMTQGISVALGTAQHVGWIKNAPVLEGEDVEEVEEYIHSIIPIHTISEIDLSDHTYDLHLQKEDLPIHFYSDRTLQCKGEFMINASALPVKAVLNRAVRLSDERVISWMED